MPLLVLRVLLALPALLVLRELLVPRVWLVPPVLRVQLVLLDLPERPPQLLVLSVPPALSDPLVPREPRVLPWTSSLPSATPGNCHPPGTSVTRFS